MTAAVDFVALEWEGRSVHIEYQWLGAQSSTAPLMVFLHEGLGSVSMWRDFPAALCDALQCRGLVYSRPGYGQSTARAAQEAWGPDFMHRQAHGLLPALLQALGIDPARDRLWLLGHSDGGSIALLYAAQFSDQIAGAVVLAPHILVEDVSLVSIREARRAYVETTLRQRLARHHADVDSAFYGWNDVWLQPGFRQWNIADTLCTITCPLLAVQGEDDVYGTLEQIRGIARAVPHCQLLEMAHCGHSPHQDRREDLIAGIRNFFSQQPEETHL